MFPVFLKLSGRKVLVVGGGSVALSKIEGLRRSGARITVVAPVINDGIEPCGLTLVVRRVRPSDLDDAWLVVSAATPVVNRRIAKLAEARKIFVNAVDDPANASAYLGGVIRRSDVTIAISTNGRAPAIAGLLREGLDQLLPADLDRWLTRADQLRRRWRRRREPMAGRRPELLRALNRLYRPDEVRA